ncbi:hypothetical protein AVEN_70574-1 [Araneus ventricosus]|uniref:Uncharacterized protein n=1 Tax=Araneus ventricosus TaxID=182803 RepID=A0A4Y2PQ24_ARAVE|nr:hypothetical protein AVEN_70574-1 [Araneus ventricosus]
MYISQYPPPDIGNSFCLVVRIFGSEPKCPRFYPAAKVVTRTKNTQQLSVPLIDGSTKDQVNSIFCYIHQMAALQLLQQCSSPNSKPVTHFTARKVYDHLIAQSLQVPAHQVSGQMHAAHRFLNIQKISNKLGGCSCGAPCYTILF